VVHEIGHWQGTAPLNAMMRRICLFSFDDAHGLVDDYIVFFLRELGRLVERTIFVSSGPLSADSKTLLGGLVDEVIVLHGAGVEVGMLAYKVGLETIVFDREGLYDEVLLVDHSCYGPVYPFSELFTEMDGRSCDFWGITAHLEVPPDPLTGTKRQPYHLNANFIAVRRNMLQSKEFKQYWDAVNGDTAVPSRAALFTEHFTRLGYVRATYLDCSRYGTHDPALLEIDETLMDRNPLIQRNAFIHDPRLLEHHASDLPRALQILEHSSTYDRSLIWRNVVRSGELRTLNTNAALTSVLPDVRLKQDGPLPDYGRIAVCVHVYYTDMLEEILSHTDTIPCTYDFIATTQTEARKAIIEKVVTGRKNVGKVIIRVVEQNRGRDMSSLFITCRDLFLEDRYDLVCRLHTKKSPHVAAGRANLFKRHLFGNVLNSPGFTTNVLDMFHDTPWLGVAVPPLIHIGYLTMGHAWAENRARAQELARELDLRVHFDLDTPVGTFGSMYWFRPKALRKLFAHPWQWSDFEEEPYPVDGSLGHALERLICYVAQDARYTTQQIISSHLAGQNFAMLEYKLQKLSTAFLHGDFSYQANFVEMTPLRRALTGLIQVFKQSIAKRVPFVAHAMRPIYRTMKNSMRTASSTIERIFKGNKSR
jgi:lipopolysaccharide biosynthesis protein